MRVDGKDFRTIWLAADGEAVDVIDQTKLPHRFEVLTLRSSAEAADAIKRMVVRGAPLIGATAAYGMALAAREDSSDAGLGRAYDLLFKSRPTAVNLRWALERMRGVLLALPASKRVAAAYAEAARIADEDVAVCAAIGENGATLIEAIAESRSAGLPVNVLTHCNAGWLATVDWGTALAPIFKAHRAGIPVHVWVDETRPRNQGASLTAWELNKEGVPHTVIADNTGGHLMQHGMVDLCHRRHRPHDARGRRRQQDRHVSEGARRARQRRAVLRRAPLLHHRLAGARRGEGDSDRGAQRGGGDASHRRDGGGRDRHDPHHAGGKPGGELCLRRDAGAARHRAHHRARRLRGIGGGADEALSRGRGGVEGGRRRAATSPMPARRSLQAQPGRPAATSITGSTLNLKPAKMVTALWSSTGLSVSTMA